MPRFNENDFYQIFSRRAFLIGASQVGLLSLLVARLYYLQVVEADKYALLARDNSIKVRLLMPPRGQIIDCNKKLIVGNSSNFKAVLKWDKKNHYRKVLKKACQLISIEEEVLEKALRPSKKPWINDSFILKENLTWPEVTILEMNSLELQGLTIEVGLSRHYLYNTLMSHVTGYISAITLQEQEKDQEEDNPLLQMPDFKIGKTGIEKTCELELRGEAGARYVEVNALGQQVRELSCIKSKTGNDIQLTIDLDLQQKVSDCLKEHISGSAVILDIHTGAVNALVSAPGFDPNQFIEGINKGDWNKLRDDPYHPLQNKAIAGVYSPGSVFKMVVALAALEANVITPYTTVNCSGFIVYGGHRFHCWKHKGGHGRVDVIRAISESCDCFFYEISLLTGIDKISEMAFKMGLGKKTGIELIGEQSGLVPTKEWKSKVKRRSWIPSDTILAGIGQGYISCTPLQLALMTARIANGGKGINPYLCHRSERSDVEEVWDISPTNLAYVLRGMEEVMSNPRGTAHVSRFHFPGLQMAGKTGTAQVKRISHFERESGLLKGEHRPWRERDHALFVGYAPVHNPQYAAAVVLEHAGGGSRFAAPVARDILMAALGICEEKKESVKDSISFSSVEVKNNTEEKNLSPSTEEETNFPSFYTKNNVF
jgi:penicillin-binding protein 2